MSVQVKRQGNLNATTCTNSPIKPNSLAYGELAMDSSGYIYGGNGHGQVVSLIRAADRAGTASTASYAVSSANSNQLQGRVFTTSSFGSSATFANHIPIIRNDGAIGISRYIDFHGDSYSRNYSLRFDTGTASNLIITGPSASTVTASYFNGDAKNSNTLGGQGIDYFAKATDLQNIPHLYSADFLFTNWSGEGPYTQTATLIAEDGGPAITASSKFFSAPMCEQGSSQEANEILQSDLSKINMGKATLGNNTVTVQVWEKPENSIKIFWNLKK